MHFRDRPDEDLAKERFLQKKRHDQIDKIDQMVKMVKMVKQIFSRCPNAIWTQWTKKKNRPALHMPSGMMAEYYSA